MVSMPIIFTSMEDKDFPEKIKEKISSCNDSELLLKYPVVYIHYWPSEKTEYTLRTGQTVERQRYDIYIGESNDIVQRTSEHFNTGKSDNSSWQHGLINNKVSPCIIVIGHEHFNKSFTLDIENRLIEYTLAMTKSVRKPLNGRGNPQNTYYPSTEFNEIFSKIWRKLRKENSELFLTESEITDSALFKASPLKKLMPEQIAAKEQIMLKVRTAYESGQEGQLIFVQGEAGTGKTVLTTSLFYDLIKRGGEEDETGTIFPKMSCYLMVNHDQQAKVYEQMSERLGLGKGIVSKPTSFINKHSPKDKVDVAFIDEGHLLLTQGKMSYRGENQLQDIIDRAKVTVIMFDEYQVLTTEEYWEPEILDKFKNMSKSQGNYIQLSNQLRMNCAESTTEWINNFILNRKITKFIPDNKGYKVKSFDNPKSLYDAIKDLAGKEDTKLSRIVASYDWEYDANSAPDDRDFWDVKIGDWSLPWNYELEKTMDRKQKMAISHMAWAEQDHTINECGSTFTIQGFDLSYVGVILGPSVKYRDGHIVFDPEKSKNDKVKRNRTLSDKTQKKFGEIFIRNEVKVLMTRGVKGLYIFACDEALRRKLKECLGSFRENIMT